MKPKARVLLVYDPVTQALFTCQDRCEEIFVEQPTLESRLLERIF
jgi:hypothetical protein